ncbi:MAG TPA: hypothetical protein VGR51_07095, partial [Thermoplasmata archaeon]|nr:hypothetical protein [Thermoplasmata archaeon]
ASGDIYIAGNAGDPPYTFGSGSSQTFRVRNSTLTDPAALVGTPAGTLGTPDGVASPLDVTEPSPFGGAVLLCLSLG